ncbi:cilia- and flagella-associated protein 276 [Culicoides brevitarsis]|uniref:cilia- and flagella-associated protein 276 n=1 Tax=Culicoides brevitarsis TaxID=469753 RepID=UPI00307BD421
MIEEIRNMHHVPFIQAEGYLLKNLPSPRNPEDEAWANNLSTHERVFLHQTLASTRRSANFQNYPIIPRDSLDIILSSQYNHSDDLFGGKNLTVLQDETCDKRTFRRLRNTKDVEKIIPLWHPLKIGGISEKQSPHSVKLMNHGPHTPLTNPGYSRQNFDGNFFNY